MRKKDLGIINLSGKVRVTDPCYDIDIWCSSTLNMMPGEYRGSAVFANYDMWGERVKELRIVHRGYNGRKKWEAAYKGTSVDSGQAGFFDYDYYEKNQGSEEWYRRVCDVTLYKDAGDTDEKGVVSSSGLGDGVYGCMIARNETDEIIAAKLIFL